MKKIELNNLKKEHNKLHAEGCDLWERIEAIFVRVTELRKQIKSEAPKDYDDIRILFCGDFDVDEAEFAEAERQIQTGGF